MIYYNCNKSYHTSNNMGNVYSNNQKQNSEPERRHGVWWGGGAGKHRQPGHEPGPVTGAQMATKRT